MRNQWIYFYSGIVTVKASGKGLERLLNTLTKSEIYIWNVKKLGTEAISFRTTLEDAKKIRHMVRKSGWKIEFLTRTGFPFLIKRMIKNGGFLIGAFVFLSVIFVLSNMIWDINIKGADPATEYKIRKELDNLGVKKGKLQFLVQDPESIQRSISNNIDGLTWVGVELQGTTYHLQVVEKSEPEKPEQLSPRNLVAKKKAVIVDMFVENGQPQVEINDHVKPGQILVSGQIGSEDDNKLVPAEGEILGETWYKSKVIQPLETTLQVFNGNEESKHLIKLGNISIPIWGFGNLPFKNYEMETDVKQFHFVKWKLPFTYTIETYRESEEITRTYTKKEALEVAKEMARKDIKNQLSDDATIKGEKILHHSTQNGKVYLIMLIQVIENIAQAQPIIQGESE